MAQMSAAIQESSRYYNPGVLNTHLLPRAKRIAIYLLPYTKSLDIEDSLEELPFPVITMRLPFKTAKEDGIFPQDAGMVVDGVFHTTQKVFREIGSLFNQADLPKLWGRVRHMIVDRAPDGGSAAVSSTSRDVVTTDRGAVALFGSHGYRTYKLPDGTLKRLRGLYPNDWTYVLSSHVDHVATLVDESDGVTLFIDEHVDRLLTRRAFPRGWNISPVDHGEVQEGVLNLAFLGKRHVLAPERMRSTELGERISRNRRVVYQPQSIVSDYAGAKCRSLLLSLM